MASQVEEFGTLIPFFAKIRSKSHPNVQVMDRKGRNMLLRFQVANHRSVLDPVEFSMIAVDEERSATRGFDLLSDRVLTVAGVYGPNASGKTNVLEALSWLSDAVRHSLRGWDDFVPRDPHRFGEGPARPSGFEVELMVNGVRHRYRLEVDDSAVLYEGLHSYPKRRERTLFEREGDRIEFRRGLERAKGIKELLTPTTLALSAGLRLRDPEIHHAGLAVGNMTSLGFGNRRMRYRPYLHTSSERLFRQETPEQRPTLFPHEGRATALELLRFADPGIDSVETVERDRNGGRRSRRLVFIRQVDNARLPFELEEESAGTLTWFRLLGPALAALERGQVILLDEIDASLHPRLSARLLDLFRDPQTNPRGAQLLFTSHDTSLLNTLNRDEIWFTERAPKGATQLVALAEYRIRERKALHVDRAYLQGRFGAVPDVDQIDVRRALRHVAEGP